MEAAIDIEGDRLPTLQDQDLNRAGPVLIVVEEDRDLRAPDPDLDLKVAIHLKALEKIPMEILPSPKKNKF